MNETLRLIAARRSHRAYEAKQITQEQRDALIAAALQSPSAVNRQPWHFTVVQNQAMLDRINAYCVEHARSKEGASPRFAQDDYHVFYHAPTVIFISGPQGTVYAPIDCGIAVENIAIAAESMKLGSVILGMPREAFFSAHGDEVRSMLGFPEGHDFIIAIAVGIPADTKDAHPIDENKVLIIE